MSVYNFDRMAQSFHGVGSKGRHNRGCADFGVRAAHIGYRSGVDAVEVVTGSAVGMTVHQSRQEILPGAVYDRSVRRVDFFRDFCDDTILAQHIQTLKRARVTGIYHAARKQNGSLFGTHRHMKKTPSIGEFLLYSIITEKHLFYKAFFICKMYRNHSTNTRNMVRNDHTLHSRVQKEEKTSFPAGIFGHFSQKAAAPFTVRAASRPSRLRTDLCAAAALGTELRQGFFSPRHTPRPRQDCAFLPDRRRDRTARPHR